jgi:hypothetical protein
VTAAIFGLIGVGVGAAVTGLVNWFLERSRQKADAHAAARLLKTEVVAALKQADQAVNEDKWPIAYRPTWRQSWGTYRRPLAALMDRDAFDKVAGAYAVMDEMQGGFSAGRDRRDLEYSDRVLLGERAPAALPDAVDSLERFIADLDRSRHGPLRRG